MLRVQCLSSSCEAQLLATHLALQLGSFAGSLQIEQWSLLGAPGIATRSKGLTSSNKKLLGTVVTILVTIAFLLLLVRHLLLVAMYLFLVA